MRIALFGGSFDPPHWGHVTVARAAADRFELDRLLFAPAGLQPLKPKGASAPFADRLAMVELLCREDDRFEASTLDAPIAGGEANYTIDALQRLRAEAAPGSALFVLVGADSFLDLRRWRSPDELIEAAEWIVVSRPGFSLAKLEALGLTPAQRVRVHLLEGVEVPVSATVIRDCLQARRDCAEYLPARVLAYARDHGLYRAS